MIAAIIGAVTTIVAAIITVSGSIKQASLPIEATKTADAFHTLLAMTAQLHLPDATESPSPTDTSVITFTSTPSSTLEVENQLIQLIDNYYTCINAAHPDLDNDYETCWNLLSNQPGEYQSHLNKEDFKSFWKQYKVAYVLYYCSVGTEKFVDAEYYLYNRSDLSAPIGKYYLEYSFALDSKGWRIKGGDNSISGIGSYCENQPRIEKLTLIP